MKVRLEPATDQLALARWSAFVVSRTPHTPSSYMASSVRHVAAAAVVAVLTANCAWQQGLSDGGLAPLDAGSWVASVTRGWTTSLYVLSHDRDPERLTRGDDVTPAVSPDRRLVAFSRLVEGRRRQLWVLDRSANQERQIVASPHHDYSPVFVSDTEVAFLRGATDRTTSTLGHRWVDWDLFLVNIQSGVERTLTTSKWSRVSGLSVDRANRRLGLVANQVGAEPTAVIIAVDSGTPSEVTLSEPASLTLDPRGAGLVFRKHVGENASGRLIYELFKAGPSGENVQRVTSLNVVLWREQYAFGGEHVTALDDLESEMRAWSIPLDGRAPTLLKLRLP